MRHHILWCQRFRMPENRKEDPPRSPVGSPPPGGEETSRIPATNLKTFSKIDSLLWTLRIQMAEVTLWRSRRRLKKRIAEAKRLGLNWP